MERLYTIFAAMRDETNEAWIWFSNPRLGTRTVVKVHNPKTGRVVFCESRKIDLNFLAQYNERPHTQEIRNPDEALVISEWYRDALGGFSTTCNSGHQVSLGVTRARIPGWRSLRASCHHPDIAVRLGVRLGALGIGLGLVGLMAALLELADLTSGCRVAALIATAVVGATVGTLACRGVKAPVS